MNLFNHFIYSNQPWIRFLRHFLFWAADIVNYVLVLSIHTEITLTEVYRIVFQMPFIILVTYFILYYLIPKFSGKTNPMAFYLWVIGILLFLGFGMRYYMYYILEPLIAPDRVLDFNVWDFRRVLSQILQTMVVISMAIAIKLIKNKTELQQKNEELVAEKKAAELNFLKAQMHPHFLFNTLNTLYADAIQGTGKSEQIVLRLSSLLRFILEECSKPRIPIDKEIKVIEDYIALEKLRHGSRLHINLALAIEDKAKCISPLLLLPFIENSCKHTLSTIRGNICITVAIKSENGFVNLFVENERSVTVGHPAVNHGVGIANVKKQLNLLYDGNFTLDIQKDTHKYSVHLKFPISDA